VQNKRVKLAFPFCYIMVGHGVFNTNFAKAFHRCSKAYAYACSSRMCLRVGMGQVRADLGCLHRLACVNITESMNMILMAALEVVLVFSSAFGCGS
jgi:hypothetical protein